MINKKTFLCLALFLVFSFILVFSPGTSASSVNDEPEYVYLVSTSNPAHTMTVSWRTGENYVGEVHYDTESENGNTKAYSFKTPGAGAVTTNQFEGYVNHVELSGLEPDTQYYFVCGNPEYGWSEEFSFRTAPVERENIRFVVGGDSRNDTRYEYPEWPSARDNISKLMADYNPDFVIFVGDYLWDGETQPAGDTWDNWLGAVFKYWRGDNNRLIPIIPVIGNHELEPYPVPPVYDPMVDASNFYMLFDLPVEGENYAYYSLNWGPDLHITVLDSEIRSSESDPFKEQVSWLHQDLKNHKDFLWKIAADHRPFLRKELERYKDWVREFESWHLDIMFHGHEHYYERSEPVTAYWEKEVTSPENGTIYVISGGWGAPNYESNSAWFTASGPIKDYHFTLLDILDNGMLRYKAINIDNEIIDEFTIQKEVSLPSPEPSTKGLPVLPVVGGIVLVVFVVALFLYFRR